MQSEKATPKSSARDCYAMPTPFLFIAMGNGYGPLPAKTIEEALSSGFRDDRAYAVEVFDKSTGKCVANVRRADYSKGN